MLARMTFKPKLRADGVLIGGPPLSTQCSVSMSGRNCQVRLTLPLIDDSAPCLAALVASSCSASASPCAVAGYNEMFGPLSSILSPAR